MRKAEEYFFRVLMVLSSLIIVGSLFSILFTILYRGLGSLTWDMVSRVPEGGFYIGKEGGILNAIIGSMYIAGGATLLALLISIPIVLYINTYLPKDSRLAGFARTSFDILFGVPSIVYGAFGFTIMVFLGLKTSLLAGIITVTLLVLPIMVRTMDEITRLVPRELNDAVYSLGATRWETSKVILRQVAPGILTAILLSFGRGMGDAASVLFTAGYTDSIPTSLSDPAATLPLAIFFQLSSPIMEVQERAYAATLVLTLIILLISILSRIINVKLSKHKIQ
ncbi:MAG TPA: phosphate ABC transporter permease PstA [Bacteroidia bacterium]|jgi:phosphate transport system permease protein|nr:phosphate ABC transporter permease PstA [Bacteroidia bacterium]